MKGLRLFFAACLAPLVFQAVAADGTQTASRNTNRRATTSSAATAPRVRVSAPSRTDTTSRGTTTVSRATTTQTVRPRTKANTASENRALHTRTAAIQSPQVVSSRTSPNTISPRTPRTSSRTSTTSRNATRATNRGRSATVPQTNVRDAILSSKAKECREVFYGCMDEFCANKDAQLKRCACSTRINEFSGMQKNLATIEEKLLDFSQRLLTVSMDKEDAAALNQATAGELAFNQADKSQSKEMLDEIAKKLNSSFNDSNFDQGLNAISLSLNTDTAFDTIDPTAGASTTTKSGTALYSAALPVCREMAQEVCTPDELSIAEGGYQMLIEQDCNTVKKSYQTQSDAARSKVFESGALLDISRLTVHQQRNSDDILTCKAKMLDMLTDTTICGTNMEKCLDISGRYINPTTGEAILTTNLASLSDLIHAPDSDISTWAAQNTKYVSFLNGKKQYLEPAMEKCQDISDYVWELFVEDALAQIKLAQDTKLEQIRQSCTKLTAQCLDSTLDSITEFDARALSIFGIQADKTANAMCADIKTSCTALFQASKSDTTTGDGTTKEWESGVTEITTTKSYETILSTCREVGRNCIIQACTSITGNFGLCEDIDKSINRKSIISRRACWKEVYECVDSAGADTIAKIMTQHNRTATKNGGHLYDILYTKQTTIHDICTNDGICGDTETPECQTCRIAEEIWGNCEKSPKTQLTNTNDTNSIYVMDKNAENATLLSWFAHNTGTEAASDSCRDTTCPAGYLDIDGACVPATDFSHDGYYCPADTTTEYNRFDTANNEQNCCRISPYDDTNNDPYYSPAAIRLLSYSETQTNACCLNGVQNQNSVSAYSFDSLTFMNGTGPESFCSTYGAAKNIATIELVEGENTKKTFTLTCVGTIDRNQNPTTNGVGFPGGNTINCSGTYLLVSDDGIVLDPLFVFGTTESSTEPSIVSYYYPDNHDNGFCEYQCKNQTPCGWYPNTNITCDQPSGWTVGRRPNTATTTKSEE